MAQIIDIEGIGTTYGGQLAAAGIETVEQLLERGASRRGRGELAEATGIRESLILEWVNRADLFRIHGIGEQYSDLLEAAGVDTVPELAQRNAQNLHAKLEEVNAAQKLVRQLPSESAVANWVAEAKELPRVVEY